MSEGGSETDRDIQVGWRERESAYFHFVRFVFELQINVSIYIENFECASSILAESAKQFNSFPHCPSERRIETETGIEICMLDEECLHLFHFSVSFSVVCCCFIAK